MSVFGSLDRDRFTRDPAPWVLYDRSKPCLRAGWRENLHPDEENGEWVAYQPRPEYDPETVHPQNPILQTARRHYVPGDRQSLAAMCDLWLADLHWYARESPTVIVAEGMAPPVGAAAVDHTIRVLTRLKGWVANGNV